MSITSVGYGTLDLSLLTGYADIPANKLPTTTGIYVLAFDFTNAATGDTFEVYTEQYIGAGTLTRPTLVAYGGQSADISFTMPILAKAVSGVVFPSVQLYQNTGTYRTVKYEVLKVGDCTHMSGGDLLIPYASPTGHEVYASASSGAYAVNYGWSSGQTNDVLQLKVQTKWSDISTYTTTKNITQVLRNGYTIQDTGCIVTPTAFRLEAGIPEYNIANTWYLYWDAFKIGV